MKELTLYVIYAIEDGETVDCTYTTIASEASDIKAKFQSEGYSVQQEAHVFSKDDVEEILYQHIFGEFRS
jgi:hypothetical protein